MSLRRLLLSSCSICIQHHRRPPLRLFASNQPDPYAVLGIPRGASKVEAKKAHLRLVKKYHPDKLAALPADDPKRKESLSKMSEINAAWDRIEKGEVSPSGGPGGSGNAPPGYTQWKAAQEAMWRDAYQNRRHPGDSQGAGQTQSGSGPGQAHQQQYYYTSQSTYDNQQWRRAAHGGEQGEQQNRWYTFTSRSPPESDFKMYPDRQAQMSARRRTILQTQARFLMIISLMLILVGWNSANRSREQQARRSYGNPYGYGRSDPDGPPPILPGAQYSPYTRTVYYPPPGASRAPAEAPLGGPQFSPNAYSGYQPPEVSPGSSQWGYRTQ